MDYNEVWANRDTNNKMKILGPNADGTINITFDFGLTPKRTYRYQKSYITEQYKYTGYKSTWSLGKGLMDLNPQIVKEVTLAEINDEDILFSDHTGEEKINKFQPVAIKDGEKALTK